MRSSGNTTETVPDVRDILARHVSKERVDSAFEGKSEAEINEALAETNAKAKPKLSKQVERDAKARGRYHHYRLGDDSD